MKSKKINNKENANSDLGAVRRSILGALYGAKKNCLALKNTPHIESRAYALAHGKLEGINMAIDIVKKYCEIKNTMEFNENPFLKDTQVSIFSNATEAEYWQTNNCHQCKKYECESQTEEKAKCKLAFYIDKGFVVNTIPLWVAKEVGCKYDALYQTAELNEKCKQIQDVNNENNMPF